MMGIQFVIIFGIMMFKYLKIGKINNIKILKEIIMVIQKQWIKLFIKIKYLIKNITTILILKIEMEIL